MTPVIVVSAYNRPQALARLLASLQKAAYPAKARPRLIISIDRGDDPLNRQVFETAESFRWEHGSKEIIRHDQHLGLVQHFLFCGRQTQQHEAVIYLEDDLVVSPMFFHYATQALSFYDDERIGGVSLYALWFNGYTHHPFLPLADGSDAFFLQIPYTQGQAWTRAQWKRFEGWQARGHLRPAPGDDLHDLWFSFAADEWFPTLTKYLVETGQFYAYPRVSQATGFGDAGSHFSSASLYFQTPLQYFRETYQFKPLADSVAVYDSFYEIFPNRLNRLTDALSGFEYDVDLNATKARHHLKAEYALTTRLSRASRLSFGRTMWPPEANVIEAVPGRGIGLCRKDDLRWDWLADLDTRKRNHDYFTRGRRLSRRLRLQFALLDALRRLGWR
ncbi:MAG: glycosyltransferase [Chloroflexi bacterium]|nr:glycosyltransferase [Chloroflexota bacterium]